VRVFFQMNFLNKRDWGADDDEDDEYRECCADDV